LCSSSTATFFRNVSATGSRLDHVFAASAQSGVLLATRLGNGLACQAADLIGRNRQGKTFLTLDDGDEPLRPVLFGPGKDRVLCLSGEGRALVFGLDQVKALRNGGRGTALMALEPDESLRQALVFGAAGVVISGVGRGAKAVARDFSARELEAWAGVRARKGRLLEPRIRDPFAIVRSAA
jgi:topoisomerase-4 subunit A